VGIAGSLDACEPPPHAVTKMEAKRKGSARRATFSNGARRRFLQELDEEGRERMG
jgi:hypothetical protein